MNAVSYRPSSRCPVTLCAGRYYREFIEAPFFRRHLNSISPNTPQPPPLPAAVVFEVGTNVWRRYEQWPPAEAIEKTLYLHPGGVLSVDAPKTHDAYDEWVSDPSKPVPYTSDVAIGMTRAHMTDDQRFASSRTDVMVSNYEGSCTSIILNLSKQTHTSNRYTRLRCSLMT